MSKFRYIIFGLFFYLTFIFVTLPADVSYTYWKEYLGQKQPVVLSDISGSVWSGKAGMSKLGKLAVDSLQWTFQPANLLLGNLKLKWEITVTDGYAKGALGLSAFGQAALTDVEGLIPMAYLARPAGMDALRPAGSMGLNINRIEVENSNIIHADGNLAWHSAEITLLKPMLLGDLKVKLETDGDGVKGVLSDGGGPLQAEGLLTLDQEGGYNFNGALAARDPAQTDLKNALRSLGRPDKDGLHKIKRSGKLSSLKI